jgi:hypothetical protein
MSTTDSTDVVNPVVEDTDPIVAALMAMGAARVKFNEANMRASTDNWVADTIRNERNIDKDRISKALDTYFKTYPGYEISQFREWIYNTRDEVDLAYSDIRRRNEAAVDAANANLRAAIKVYNDLVAQKQMYDMQTAKLENDSD